MCSVTGIFVWEHMAIKCNICAPVFLVTLLTAVSSHGKYIYCHSCVLLSTYWDDCLEVLYDFCYQCRHQYHVMLAALLISPLYSGGPDYCQRCHMTFGTSADTVPASVTHDVSSTFNVCIAFQWVRQLYRGITWLSWCLPNILSLL